MLKFQLDTKAFDATLARYAEVSKKSLAQICNTKALWIAIHALNETPKAERSSIFKTLGIVVKVRTKTKTGKIKTKRKLSLTNNSSGVPLASLIINKRRGKAGQPGLQGKKMETAIKRMLAARLKSINFLRSSWLPAIEKLKSVASKAGGPKQDYTVKIRGRPKGSASPARDFFGLMSATIQSDVRGGRNLKGKVHSMINRALQVAVDREAASMQAYIEKQQQQDVIKAKMD